MTYTDSPQRLQPCTHGSELGCCPVDGCTHATAAERESRQPQAASSAQFASRCMACAGAVEPGDPIVMVDRRWVHEGCA